MRPPWQMLKSRQKNSADDGCSGYRPGWIPDVDLLRIGRIYGLAGYNWKLTHIKVHIMHFVYPNMSRLIKLYVSSEYQHDILWYLLCFAYHVKSPDSNDQEQSLFLSHVLTFLDYATRSPVAGLIILLIMEVENGPIVKETGLGGTHSPPFMIAGGSVNKKN